MKLFNVGFFGGDGAVSRSLEVREINARSSEQSTLVNRDSINAILWARLQWALPVLAITIECENVKRAEGKDECQFHFEFSLCQPC